MGSPVSAHTKLDVIGNADAGFGFLVVSSLLNCREIWCAESLEFADFTAGAREMVERVTLNDCLCGVSGRNQRRSSAPGHDRTHARPMLRSTVVAAVPILRPGSSRLRHPARAGGI
jgi:hypothetical protein